MATPSDSIQYLHGIGPERAKAFGRLGIRTLGDLLNHFPRGYEDRTVLRPIAELMPGESACISALAAAEPRLSRIRRGLDILKLRIVDETGSIEVTFFNQSYLKNQLHAGESYVFYGTVGGTESKKTLTNPVFESERRAGVVTGRILPLYHLTHGVSNRLLLSAVEETLPLIADQIGDILPPSVAEGASLCGVAEAYRSIHFPADHAALRAAQRRFAFQEVFALSCALSRMRLGRERARGIPFSLPDIGEFTRSLPFSPTNGQKKAVEEAFSDMASGRSMSRLVQGDVGSGKTLVAAACLWCAHQNGVQSAFMAPTEILAQQHAKTLRYLLAPFGVEVGLLTGSLGAAQKRAVREKLESGECSVCVGTHALLSEDVHFHRLGLVIADEQHRFGVEQRAALTQKGERPHVLVMSATPIPRTLALMLYGDLDVSVIRELPPGRKSVKTVVVSGSYRERLNGFLLAQAEAGHQAFVVCPMVEENDELPDNVKSAEEYARELSEALPSLRIGCCHGKLRPKEKEAAMAAFANGETDILVATTVIEVGVDVPNATVMVVENADRFGLSQLHQLRGRVGRGSAESHCILVTDTASKEARERLHVLVSTSDGFAVAEEDLRLRGPGDFFGSEQHGFPAMHMADLAGDMDTLTEAQRAAEALMRSDPELSRAENAPLREHIDRLFALREGSLN